MPEKLPNISPEDYQIHLTPDIHSDYIVEHGIKRFIEQPYSESFVYDEPLDTHTRFQVWIGGDANREHTTRITCLLTTTIDGTAKNPATLIFSTSPSGQYFDLLHRVVPTKAYGVSGTDMLLKSEHLLQRLVADKLFPQKPLKLTVGQPSVISWARKNGFTFASPEDEALFTSITTEPEKFVTDVTIRHRAELDRTGYVFTKENAQRLGIDHTKIIVAERLGDILPYSVRINLIKHSVDDR